MCGIIPYISLKKMITNTIIVWHDDYELIKKRFASLRTKWGLKYTNHYDTKYLLYHEWIGKHDKLEVSYIIDQDNPKKENGKDNWTEAWISYSFNPESEFFNGFKEMLNIISSYVYTHRVEYKPKSESKEEISPTEESEFDKYLTFMYERTNRNFYKLLKELPDNFEVIWN